MDKFNKKLPEDMIARYLEYMEAYRLSYSRLAMLIGLPYQTFKKAFIDREPVRQTTCWLFEQFAKAHGIKYRKDEEVE